MAAVSTVGIGDDGKNCVEFYQLDGHWNEIDAMVIGALIFYRRRGAPESPPKACRACD
jgi:hypothetical protein